MKDENFSYPANTKTLYLMLDTHPNQPVTSSLVTLACPSWDRQKQNPHSEPPPSAVSGVPKNSPRRTQRGTQSQPQVNPKVHASIPAHWVKSPQSASAHCRRRRQSAPTRPPHNQCGKRKNATRYFFPTTCPHSANAQHGPSRAQPTNFAGGAEPYPDPTPTTRTPAPGR